MRWTAPPERREIVLVLVSITAYLLAYNIETSLSYVGIDPVAAQGAVFRRIGLGKTKVLGRDGRKPSGWRDSLELEIFGSWAWDQNHIAGDGDERRQTKGSGRHGAQWIERRVAREFDSERFGEDTINESFRSWKDDIPLVSVVKHVPVELSTWLQKTEQVSPPLKSIVETTGSGHDQWQVVTKTEALDKVGKYGGFISGVSWMSLNDRPSNTTLVDLWRVYSSLDHQIDDEGHTNLPPPRRLIYPRLPYFSDPDPEDAAQEKERPRTDTGLDHYLLKAAFPQLDVQYRQDWQDYHKMSVPFVFERLVISDRTAAAQSVNEGQPANSPPFSLEASGHWWEPVRRTLVSYFDRLGDEASDADGGSGFWGRSKSKKVIAFIDNQSDSTKSGKSAMIPEDYDYLARSLRKLGRDNGYEVHVISTNLGDTTWEEKMDVIIRSTIVIGVHGDHLFDAMWMRPSSKATLMELFPQGTFSSNRELVTRALGLNYIAWWTDEHFSGESLPAPTKDSNQPVHINVDKVIKEIHAILSRKEEQ
ncbi:hypothetical protein H1R20_g2922, partial [Candolleomyces eurysporus]